MVEPPPSPDIPSSATAHDFLGGGNVGMESHGQSISLENEHAYPLL